MQIETYIDSLISYAMNTGLCEPEDHMILQNRLLEALGKNEYIPSCEEQSEDLEEILKGILDYAVANGLCDDNITARDLFDGRINAIAAVGMGQVRVCGMISQVDNVNRILDRVAIYLG